MSKKTVVLGAGLAGLSTALHLKNNVEVYEKELVPGGLSGTDYINGFVFDYDGHLLHFKTEYAKRLVNSLLSDLLQKHKRNAWVYSHDVYTKYPFQANTFGLPLKIVKKCILGMFKASRRGVQKNDSSLYDWMIDNFGKGITKYFMYPYNHKFWTVAPERLIPDWTAEYVPRVRIRSVLDGALTYKTKPLGYNSEFWYPKTGGMDQLSKAMAGRIKNIEYNSMVTAIDLKNKVITLNDRKKAGYSELVSSIPMISLKQIISDDLPLSVTAAFDKLKYVSIYNLNLGIKREKITDKHWIYYPEDDFSFFRVGFPMNFSDNVCPGNTSSLYAEVSYSGYRPLDRKNIDSRIKKDLIRAGILNSEDEVVLSHSNDIKYAYVIYDREYKESVKMITDFLRSHDVFSVGRFGRWKYMSMEDVINDGVSVAGEITGS